jgi:type II secretory pathway pseudopilin PulG
MGTSTKKLKKYSAFSFIEVMLSVAILSVGIVGMMPLFISNLRVSMDSRDQIIADMLAQEGTELVQSLRDNNLVSGVSGGIFDGATFPSSSSNNCRISYDTDKIICDGAYQLNLDSNKFYTHSTGTVVTKFQRKINVTYSPNSDNATATKAEIVSMVIWAGSTFPATDSCNVSTKCVYAKLILTKWN